MLFFKIAFRYLRAKKSHRAVNIITLIAVIGVAIATMAMVLVMSIFNGFSDLAESQLSALDPELAVVPARGKVLDGADSLAVVVGRIDGVVAAVPTITEKAVLIDGTLRVPVNIKGIPYSPGYSDNLERLMIAGEYATATSYGVPAVQLAVGVANQIRQTPSSISLVQVVVPRRNGRINPANPAAAFRSEEFAFSGVFSTNSSDIDGSYAIMPLDAAREVLDYTTEASQIEVTADARTSVESLKKRLVKELGPGYKVLNRIEQRADSFRMISVEKWVTFMMLIAILVIALFNVVSTLSLLAIEKRDNMRTLRSLGAPASMIRNVFIAEGFLVTTTGGAIGIVAGIALALGQQFFHFVKLQADAATLTIDYYPVRVDGTDIALVALVIVVLAMVVSTISRFIVPKSRFDYKQNS